MDNSVTRQLLDAEKALKDITQSLVALKAEVGGYAGARKSLEQTESLLGRLMEELESLAREQTEVARVLRSIGPEQILDAIARSTATLETGIQGSRRTAEAAVEAVRNVASTVARSSEETHRLLSTSTSDIMSTVQQSNRAVMERFDGVEASVVARAAATEQSMRKALSETRSELSGLLAKLQDRLKWAIIVCAILHAVGLALLTYVCFAVR